MVWKGGGQDPYPVISQALSAQGPLFLTEAPQDPTCRPRAVSPQGQGCDVGGGWRLQEGLYGTCPFPEGQSPDVRTSQGRHKSRRSLALWSDPTAGCVQGGWAFRRPGLSQETGVPRISLKMAPNPTLLLDIKSKEIRAW